MKLRNIAITALAGIAGLSLATYALPRHVSVERSAVIPAEPTDIMSLAASNAGFQTFNPYKTLDPELAIELYGPEKGVGSAFHFDGKDGTGTQTIANVGADHVTYAIDLGPMGQPTQFISVLPVDNGTEVTWRVESDMGFNPVFRIFGLFMDGMMGPTFELGLENLAKVTA